MKKRINGPDCFGFTLIEVLLTVLIVAIMAGSLYATFSAGIKLDHRIQSSLAVLDESRIVIEQLRNDLGKAASYDFRGSFPEQKAFFDNDENLTFVIDNGQELRWVRYRIVDKEKSRALVRDEGEFIQLFDTQPILKADKIEILTKRIAENGWDIASAGAIAPKGKPEWEKIWDKDYIPGAIRMTLLLQNDKGQSKKIISDFLLPAGGRSEL